MPPRASNDKVPVIPAGLVMIGVLAGRRRRKVPMKDQSQRYCFALTVRTEDRVERVERWSDEAMPEDMPVVGEKVAIPVRVRLFTSGTGLQYRLVYQDEEAGEEF